LVTLKNKKVFLDLTSTYLQEYLSLPVSALKSQISKKIANLDRFVTDE